MSIPFDRVADIYDETRALNPDVMAQLVRGIVQMTQAIPDTHFFEPGIGTGRIALPFLEQGYAYTGIDISEPMMEKLRQKAQGLSGALTLMKADVTHLPFDDGSFDVAIASHLLHLVPDWRTALDEMHRVIKPGGVIIYMHHSPTQTPIGSQWEAILARHNYEMTWAGAMTEDVLAYWAERNVPFETRFIARETRQRTVSEHLQHYRNRIYSNLWRIPDDIFHQALPELEAWATDTYPDPTVSLELISPVTISAATITEK